MLADLGGRHRGWIALSAAALGLTLLAGCTSPAPAPSASSTVQPRPFTVAVLGAVTTTDPAVATSRTDSILVTSVYQRLMRVAPGSRDLKPDAATDCAFTSRLTYECTLPTTLRFHNGDPLDSTDVRFSIQRLLRMGGSGTSLGLLSSLRRIETPDAQTVRFVLSRQDNQFGYALAAQAASIVDSRVYDPDTALPLTTLPVGSGPFSVAEISAKGATLRKAGDYVGPTAAQLDELRLTVLPDSLAAEEALAKHTTDVAWACLDPAAQQRVDNEISTSADHTAHGFTTVNLSGVKVTRLYWNPASKRRGDKRLRLGVAGALQTDRSLDSIVPLGVPERVSAFAVGGRAKLPKIKGKRVLLTLGWQADDAGQHDVAQLLRDRIESLDSVSVRLTTSRDADLLLTVSPAWVDNATGWLQLYVEAPLSSSQKKLAGWDAASRLSIGSARNQAVAAIQTQAAVDDTVLPVSQTDQSLLLGPGTAMADGNFGSGQQLGLWGFHRD
ncbi:MAG TPA: ABC transporter substrate-binding protein [Propionicimonas sp.]|nr:ABC transporter substrate-binding protein [Propionicimonas sp.]